MSDTKSFSGVGFGVHGPEESYILFVDDDGAEHVVQAHQMVPEDARPSWAFYEALTGGFGYEHGEQVLRRERENAEEPRAYRMKITIESEPLTREETRALLARARKKKTEGRDV